MATHKPFRELVPPGTNFEFVGKRRLWAVVSTLAILFSLGMLFVNQSMRGSMLNWNIDFMGGTKIVFEFEGDREVGSGDVRSALTSAGYDGIEVSEYRWSRENEAGETEEANGHMVRTTDFGALSKAEEEAHKVAFAEHFKDREIIKASWSGDTLHVVSAKLISGEDASKFFATIGLELKPWSEEDDLIAVEGANEYRIQFAVWGLDRQYQQVLAAELKDVKVSVVQVDGVGAKAGERLRDDGIKSLFYAIALIMLYLAVRFDIRYAPGAVVALLHDAILVVGAFAVSWMDFSLTTVAALLTVIGYSVNDTVVIFDRIRENVERLKDKKVNRIINISLNETLARTLLTSITLFVVTLMMNIFGTGLVRNFAFAMNVGVIVGVYSSIFVASPVMLAIHNRFFTAEAAKASGARGGKRARVTSKA